MKQEERWFSSTRLYESPETLFWGCMTLCSVTHVWDLSRDYVLLKWYIWNQVSIVFMTPRHFIKQVRTVFFHFRFWVCSLVHEPTIAIQYCLSSISCNYLHIEMFYFTSFLLVSRMNRNNYSLVALLNG